MKYAIFHKGKRLSQEYSSGQEAQCAVMRMGLGGYRLAEYAIKEIRIDPDCPYCGGSGERFWHMEDCINEFCCLAGGLEDCNGQVETCACVEYI